MIAADSSVVIPLLHDHEAETNDLLYEQLCSGNVILPPVVVAELLSYPELKTKHRHRIEGISCLAITDGYWQRAGLMRAKLIKKKLSPKLPDTLIAQSCIDHDVPLLTRDTGFKIFAKHAGLKLYKG